MSPPRLTTSLWVSALLRRILADGYFAQVLAKGDVTAGAVILSTRSRQGDIRTFERTYTPAGDPAWIETGSAPISDSQALDSMAKARRRDPDVWWVEAELDDITPYIDGPLLQSHKR